MNRNMRCILLIGFLASLSCDSVARADETLSERQRRIEKMDPQAKQELLRCQERFLALEPEKQEQIRRLHEEIQSDPNRDNLRRVLARYYEWLKTLTLHQQAELRELPPEERVRRIGELQAEQARRGPSRPGSRGFQFAGERFPIMPRPILPADLEQHLRWIREYADKHSREFFEELPAETKKQLENQLAGIENPARRQEIVFWLIWLRWHLDHPGNSDFLTDEELDRLQSGLSPKLRAQLDGLSPSEKRARLFRSIRTLALNQYIRRSESIPAVVSRQELDDFFEKKLDPKQRDAMSTFAPQDMERRLFLHFLNSKLPEEARLGIGPGRARRGGPGRGATRGFAHPGAGKENRTGQSGPRPGKNPQRDGKPP